MSVRDMKGSILVNSLTFVCTFLTAIGLIHHRAVSYYAGIIGKFVGPPVLWVGFGATLLIFSYGILCLLIRSAAAERRLPQDHFLLRELPSRDGVALGMAILAMIVLSFAVFTWGNYDHSFGQALISSGKVSGYLYILLHHLTKV
jgi:hypothetical protein